MNSRQVGWLLGATLAVAAVWLSTHSALRPLVPDPWVPLWKEVVEPLSLAVLPWFLVLVLAAALLTFTDERRARPKGDIDRLLRRKRGGLLLRAWQRHRKRAPWGAGAAKREEGTRAASPEQYLDRLLARQRRRRPRPD